MNLTSSTPQEGTPLIPALAINSLGNHIESCFTEAQTAKQPIIERLLACERQRRGEYTPRLKAMLAETGAQEIFMMLTDIKCRAADSWIKDVIQNHSETTWACDPTPEPDLPPDLVQEITQVVMQEAAQVAAMGVPVDPATMEARTEELHKEVTQRINDMARERADRMETRIADKLEEGGWRQSQSELIYDFTTYPAVFLKGPVLRQRKALKWSKGFRPVVQDTLFIEVDRVSPWDLYPSPAAVDIQDGYLIHRHRLTRKSIRQMETLPGASKQAIRNVLETYRLGLKHTLNGDSERELLQGRNVSWATDNLIETLEYWGPASGTMLKEWGMKDVNGQPIDDLDEYQINAWKVGPYVIRAQINPDPLDQRPYSKACFEEVPGQMWGIALPEMMADVQTMCNAAARALAMNMGLASGPQVEVHTDRLAPGEVLSNIRPWKMWQTTSDRSGNGQPAVHFFQPDMNAGELLQIYTHFAKIADEVTGVPNYVYGSSNVSGAGRTSSGLAMLMENAAKGIKHAILGLDSAMSQVIRRVYNYLMEYDPDTEIKGDMNIIASGAIGAMLREQQLEARKQFMQETLNPVDAQIIGPEGRAYMLRETVKGLFSDASKIIPDAEKMKAMVAQQQQQAAMMQQQQAAQQQQQPAPA